MSGIAGIIRFDGAPAGPALVERMTSALSHRGPDGIHHWTKGPVALGHCMLRTTPESLDEQQPLVSEDGCLVLVIDGRVDNWEELRQELLGRGAALRDRSDAELVLHAYATWGQDCLARIDGDFAFVIWDARRQAAFCARDQVGNRPLNYHWDGTTLAFASEVKAILTLPWVRREFNEAVLAEFLGNDWYSRDETFWKGVNRLVAAHRMEAVAGGVRTERYWAPDPFASLPFKRDDEYVDCYRELFADVVRRKSRSHCPVAFEVSGGLDSSAIFGMAEVVRRNSKLPAPETRAYTLDFRGDADADELEYVRAVSQHLDVPVYHAAPARRAIEWYRRLARESGEFPGYPNGTMALGLRAAARADGCRVLLAGEGGDEWLGLGNSGYYYAEELASGNWRNTLACVKADAHTLGVWGTARWFARSGLAPVLPAPLKRMTIGIQRLVYSPAPFDSTSRRAIALGRKSPAPSRPRGELWLTPALRAKLDERRAAYRPPIPADLPRRSQRLQLQVLYAAYGAIAREMEERSIGRQGLELRLPLYDPKIIQFALSTPERLRSLGRSTKRCHRLAMQGTLPESVVQRTTKADFMNTFRTQFDEIEKEIATLTTTRRADWIRPEIAAAFIEHRRDPALAGWVEWPLWSLVGCDGLI